MKPKPHLGGKEPDPEFEKFKNDGHVSHGIGEPKLKEIKPQAICSCGKPISPDLQKRVDAEWQSQELMKEQIEKPDAVKDLKPDEEKWHLNCDCGHAATPFTPNTLPPQDTQGCGFINPSYDKNLPPEIRLADFLGKYHVILNGVVAHDPYEKQKEDGGGMCCQEHKKEIIDFTRHLLEQEKQKAVQELATAYDEYIKILDDELKELMGIAVPHGRRSTRVEAGKKARAKIDKLKP